MIYDGNSDINKINLKNKSLQWGQAEAVGNNFLKKI